MALSRARYDLVALTVLALLAERPRHPYAMQQLIRQRHKDFAAGPPRRLYHAVDRLTRAGLIEAAEVEREGNRPERSIYRITAEGREELTSWLVDLIVTLVPDGSLFTAALSFLILLPVETATTALHDRATSLHGAIASLDAQISSLQTRLPRAVLVEVEHSRALHAAELSWVSTLLNDIESGAVPWDAAAIGAGAMTGSQDTREN